MRSRLSPPCGSLRDETMNPNLAIVGLLAGLAFVGVAPTAAAQGDLGDLGDVDGGTLACVGNVATTCAPGALCVGNAGVPLLGPSYSCGGNVCVANVVGSCSNSLCVANVLTACGGGTPCYSLPGVDSAVCLVTVCVGNVATDCNAGICIANALSTCNGPVCVGNVLTVCGTLWDLLFALLASLGDETAFNAPILGTVADPVPDAPAALA